MNKNDKQKELEVIDLKIVFMKLIALSVVLGMMIVGYYIKFLRQVGIINKIILLMLVVMLISLYLYLIVLYSKKMIKQIRQQLKGDDEK